MVVHARLQAGLAVGAGGVGGHGDDGQARQAQLATDAPGGAEAVEHRHLQVHQHGVEAGRLAPQPIERQLAVAGQLHRGALGAQQFLRHLLVDEVVLHQQQAQAAQARRARTGRLCLHGADEGVEQHRGGDGLDQQGVEQRRAGRRLAALATILSTEHQHQAGRPAGLTDACRGLEAVQAGHAFVHQHGVEWVAGLRGLVQPCQPLRATVGRHGAPAQGQRQASERRAGGGVVVDHQQVQRARIARGGGQAGQPQAEGEAAAFAQAAAQAQFAAHQGHQTLADGQPQAGAAEAPRDARIGLREALEQARLLLGADADAGVAHLEAQLDPLPFALLAIDAQHHLALRGELERVAQQVDQHLLQAQRVAKELARHFGCQVEEQLDRLVGLGRAEHHAEVAQQGVEQEGLRIERHLAGLDLGEVQGVVEDAQQRPGGAARLVQMVGLARIEAAARQQVEHAQHGVQRGADLVAHIGQELPLGLRRRLGLLLGLHQLGEVDADAHHMAVAHRPVDDAHDAPVGVARHLVDRPAAPAQHAFAHEGVDVAALGQFVAALDQLVQQGFVAHAGPHGIAVAPEGDAEGFVEEHQAILRVVEGEGHVQRVDGAAQQLGAAPHLRLRLAARADVLDGADDALRPAAHRFRLGHAAHPQAAVLGGDEGQLEVELSAARAQLVERGVQRQLGIGGKVADRLLDAGLMTDRQVMQRTGLVRPVHALVQQVVDETAGARHPTGAVQQVAAEGQLGLAGLQRGDVGGRSEHALGLAVGRARQQAAPRQQPDPAPVLVTQALLDLVEGLLAAEMALGGFARVGQIVGVDQRGREDLARRGAQLLQRVADQPCPLRVAGHGATGHMPLPGADAGGLDDVIEHLALVRQRQLGALAFADVAVDVEPAAPAIGGGRQLLQLDAGPQGARALAVQQALAAPGAFLGRRLGLVAQQLRQRGTLGALGRETGHALEAVVDPAHAVIGVAQGHRIGGVLRDQRGARQVGGELASALLGLRTAAQGLQQQGRRQRRQQRSGRRHAERRPALEARLEGRQRRHAQVQGTAVQREVELAPQPRMRLCTTAQQPGKLRPQCLALTQLDLQQALVERFQAGQQALDRDRRVEQTPEVVAALLRRGRVAAGLPDRQGQQHEGLRLAGQAQRRRHARLALGHGALEGLARRRVGAQVQAALATGAGRGRELGDDVVIPLDGERPLQREVAGLVGALRLQPGLEPGRRHAPHHAEAQHAGVLLRQIVRTDEGLQVGTPQLAFERQCAAHAAQALHRQLPARLDLLAQRLGRLVELELLARLDIARQPLPHAQGHQAAQQEDGGRQPPMRPGARRRSEHKGVGHAAILRPPARGRDQG